ncbi:hypothetical protein MKP15_04360 [Stenotrophomonas sp. Y6]|uniref:hypothetical protein n=1 Tax=Stenotrophomonas sp. Y6 TaxID=2920383 RepID=UPI001F063928|nr:hypothetical protein [Stenotrophomonas sp. Y6]MCH1908006.1 hypothetical protein [Stenotrophomonas sp. Y6]
MSVDCDLGQTVSVDSYSPFTVNALVGVTIGGVRKVTITHSIGGQSTELTSLSSGDPPAGGNMEKLNEIDGRLRVVEQAVTRIDERLKHMPTTVMAWGMVAALACAVWAIVTLAGPSVVATAVKAQLIEQAEKASASPPGK